MKKHLIAAAVAAAVAVPAAAQVSISGVFDVSAIANSKVETQAEPGAVVVTNPKTQTTADNNGWSTSQLLISGAEDLGGGLRASFALATGLGGGTSTFADRDRNIAVEGGFGTVRLGRFVPAAGTGFFALSQAGTNGGTGQLYGLANANATAGNANNVNNFGGMVGGSFERNNNNIQYSTRSINGITVNANYGTNSSGRSDRDGETEAKQQGLHVGYSAGPLSIGVATSERTQKREAAPAVGAVAADDDTDGVLGTATVTQRTQKANLDWIGVSYNFGAATVGVVHVKRDGKTTNDAGVTAKNDNISVNSIGVTVPMGAVTFRASMYEGDNERTDVATDDLDLNGHQLSVTYALSKRTLAYIVTGESQAERSGLNVGAGAQKTTTTAFGLSHSF